MAQTKVPPTQQSSDIVGTTSQEVSTSTFTTTETTLLTLVVTITQGMVDSGRRLKLTAFAPQAYGTTGDRARFSIYDGATLVARTYKHTPAGSTAGELNLSTPSMTMPSAGSHTYTLKGVRDTGSGSIVLYAETGAPMYLEAEMK